MEHQDNNDKKSECVPRKDIENGGKESLPDTINSEVAGNKNKNSNQEQLQDNSVS